VAIQGGLSRIVFTGLFDLTTFPKVFAITAKGMGYSRDDELNSGVSSPPGLPRRCAPRNDVGGKKQLGELLWNSQRESMVGCSALLYRNSTQAKSAWTENPFYKSRTLYPSSGIDGTYFGFEAIFLCICLPFLNEREESPSRNRSPYGGS